MPGAFLAALLVGVIRAGVGFLIGTAWGELAYFAVFLLVLIVRPQGFFGRRGAEVFGA